MRTYALMLVPSLLAAACGSTKENTDAGSDGGSSSSTEPTDPGTSSELPTGDPPPTTATTADDETSTSSASEGVSTGETTDTDTGEPGCAPGQFLSREQMLKLVAQDLSSVPVQALPFTRYVSLVHLFNVGRCEPDLAAARQAVAKLVNSLSSEPSLAVPTPIDEDGLLLRLDLRQYGWDSPVMASDMEMFADTWEMIARTNPHTIAHVGDLAEDIGANAGTDLFVLPADALVVAAALPPLYYDALRLPGDLAALEQQLGVDLAAGVLGEMENDLDKVARAAVHVSQSALNSRVAERHELPLAAGRHLWRTHDFSGMSGQDNPFLNPFEFVADAGKVLFTLPNGLHGYMIVGASGERLHELPVDIEQDFLFDDLVLRAGLSCMGCHTQGLIKMQDDLRFELDNGQTEAQFDAVTKDQIRSVHPLREEMDAVMMADIAAYAAASESAGVPLAAEEQVSATFLQFSAPVDLARAAAELWMPAEELAQHVGALPAELAGLAGGTVSREVFSANFAEAVCILEIGKSGFCG